MYRKMMTALLAITMVAVTACSSGAKEEPAKEAAAPLALQDGKYEPAVQMSYLRAWNDDTKFKNGETARTMCIPNGPRNGLASI